VVMAIMYNKTPVQLIDEHGHIIYKTGENYTDDGSDVSEVTYQGLGGWTCGQW